LILGTCAAGNASQDDGNSKAANRMGTGHFSPRNQQGTT
jgi:hypothetical protein